MAMVLAVLTLLTAALWAQEKVETLEAERGEVFEIALPVAPSTGYIWYLESFDAEFLEKIGESTFRSVSDGGVTIEQQIFGFKALKVGSTEIMLEERSNVIRQEKRINIQIVERGSGFCVPDYPWTKSIVLIGSLGFGGMGTGFIVSESGYIVTANHVIDDFGMVVVFPDPLLYRTARLIYADEIHDIAVLKVEVGDAKLVPLTVAKLTDSRIGDYIFTLGHPYGIGWLLAMGTLAGVKYDRTGYAYLFCDIASAPGSSGSPIMTEEGKVIGILQEGIPGVGCIGIAADKFELIVRAAIEADLELAKTRRELEKLQDRARREWEKIIRRND
jgi:S1-C subfamily serine protease